MVKSPQILTIGPKDWAESKGRTLEDYTFIELDSRQIGSYEEAISGTYFSKDKLEEKVKDYARREDCEVILGYIPMIEPAISRYQENKPHQFHFKATGMVLR